MVVLLGREAAQRGHTDIGIHAQRCRVVGVDVAITAAIAGKPNPTNRGTATAAGVPNPAEPSMKDPNNQAIMMMLSMMMMKTVEQELWN